MKAVSLFLLLTGLCDLTYGQVSGRLITAAGQPIPFANVVLLSSPDSTFLQATLTDENGDYRLDAEAGGAYQVRASSLGYRSWQSPIFSLTTGQMINDLGSQVMLEDLQLLDEVAVRASKPLFQQTPEGTVVRVESSPMSKGSSALQILERSPGVHIDYRNNGIALNGKGGVAVMINGKLLRMSADQVLALLNGTSGNDIATIELLSTPGARYDAEGSAGIINIVLKGYDSPTKGTTGSVTLTAGYGRAEKGSGSISLAHNMEKLSLYGSFSVFYDRTYSDMYIDSWQNMPALGGQLYVSASDTTRIVQNNHDFTLGTDIRLGGKTTLNININGNSSKRRSTDVNQSSYTIDPDSTLFFDGVITGTSRWRSWINSVDLQTKWKDSRTFRATADYVDFTSTNPSQVMSSFLNEAGGNAGNNDSLFAPHQRGFASTAIRVGVGKVDYTQQVSARLRLEAGLKASYTRNKSMAGIESLVDDHWISRTETADEILMRESIAAGYLSANYRLNADMTLSAGLRYEHSRTLMNNTENAERIVDRKAGVLFPNIAFTKKIADESEFLFSYTKRIGRPSYNDLASFIRYSDPSAVYTGNPLLRPTITHNLKIGGSIRGKSLHLVLSREGHPIAGYQITEGPRRNLLYISPQNLLWQKSINLEAGLPLSISGWWNMSYGFTGGLRVFRAVHTREPVQKSYFGYSLNMTQSFKLPARFSAELSGWYNSVSYNSTVRVGGMGAVNAGMKKELRNNRGSLLLSVTDVFRTMKINTYYGTIAEEAFSIRNHVSINTESRVASVIKFTFTKSFGRQNAVSAEKRDQSRKDELYRLKSN